MNPPVLCAMKETYIMKQWNPSYGYAQSIACWFNSSKAHTTRSVAESCNALQIRGRLICKTFLSSKEPHKCTWLLATYFYGTNWATKTSTRSMELAKTSTSISFRSRSSESLQFLEPNAHSAKRLSEKLKVYRNHAHSAQEDKTYYRPSLLISKGELTSYAGRYKINPTLSTPHLDEFVL